MLLDIFPSFASTSANVQVELMLRCSKKETLLLLEQEFNNKTKTYYLEDHPS